MGKESGVMVRQNGVGSSAGRGKSGCGADRANFRRGGFHGGLSLFASGLFSLGIAGWNTRAADPLPTPFEIYVDPPILRSGLGGSSIDAAVRMRGVPTEGLFSYAIRLGFSGDLLRVEGTSSIGVPASLDHNGPVGAGALRLTGDGFAAVKGTVDFQGGSHQAYTGDLLATFRLVPVDPLKTGTSPLELSFFRTLGDSESLFVTGSGGVLDSALSMTGGQVVIIPEPGTDVLLGVGLTLGGVAGWGYRYRRPVPAIT